MVAGREVTPGDVRSTEQLKTYWAEGAGAAKIRWGEPNDFYRCVAEVSRYMTKAKAEGYCEKLHVRVLGVRPGQEDGPRRRR